MIYLDSAATALWRPPQVVQAVTAAMTSLGNASRGVHGGSLAADRTIYGAREKLARFFGCPRPDHVVFTCNVTEALNIAIHGLLGPGDHVLSTDWECKRGPCPPYSREQGCGGLRGFIPADQPGPHVYHAFGRPPRP